MSYPLTIISLIIMLVIGPQRAYGFEINPAFYGETSCRPALTLPSSITNICRDVDAALCSDIPIDKRRSCSERDKTIIHPQMSANEIYTFSKGCFKSAITSFANFFTEFIPEVAKAIWNLSKKAASSVASGEALKNVKGAAETSASLFSDFYEFMTSNPGDFFNNLWEKITDAISPLIQKYECHSPASRVELICGLVAEFVMPPALLAKVIVRGSRFAKTYLATKKTALATAAPAKAAPLVVKAPFGELKNSPEVIELKKVYAKDLTLPAGSNLSFMEKMKLDKAAKNTNVVYFEAENAVLKTLNDTILRDKGAVDAINNSYMNKLHKNLMANPKIKAKIGGQYKDYKSYRLRLDIKSPAEKLEYEKLLNDIYKKTNDDFIADLTKRNITKLIPPSTGNVGSPDRWFLSGIGSNALEANMAARSARSLSGTNKSVVFSTQATNFSNKIADISKISRSLDTPNLLKLKVVERLDDGTIILSKPMIQILRKNPPSNFSTKEAYLAEINKKTNELFGTKLSPKTSQDIALYFDKVDSLSPPVYAASREIIELGHAKHGIVSVDFAGIGVDNIHAQMRALSGSKVPLKTSFSRLESSVDEVTISMNKAKLDFDRIAQSTNNVKTKTMFSGDDGIFIPPNKSLNIKDKMKIVNDLGKTTDPSKFRVTFIDSNYINGTPLAKSERSLRIVSAENIEKNTRASFVGSGKISPEESSKIITAVDYRPDIAGGEFSLIVSGKKLTDNEKKLIENSFKKSLDSKSGEKFIKVIFN